MDFFHKRSRYLRDVSAEYGTLLMIVVMVFGLLVAGCTGPANSAPSKGAPDATTAPTPWSGTWDSEWGDMEFTQTGDKVTGTYTHDNGKITGTVSGNTLTGTWSEAPSYNPPADGGDFVITLAADGKSFTGKWGYGSGKMDGSWEATRK